MKHGKKIIALVLSSVLIIEAPALAAPRAAAPRAAASRAAAAAPRAAVSTTAPIKSANYAAAAAPKAFVNIALGGRPLVYRPTLIAPTVSASTAMATAQPLTGAQTRSLTTPIFGPTAGQPTTPSTQPIGSILNPSPTSPTLPAATAPAGFFSSMSWPEKIFLTLFVAFAAYSLYKQYTEMEQAKKDERRRREEREQRIADRRRANEDLDRELEETRRDNMNPPSGSGNGEQGAQPPPPPLAGPPPEPQPPAAPAPGDMRQASPSDATSAERGFGPDDEVTVADISATMPPAPQVQPAPAPIVATRPAEATIGNAEGREVRGSRPAAPQAPPTAMLLKNDADAEMQAGLCPGCLGVPKDPTDDVLSERSKNTMLDLAEPFKFIRSPVAIGARKVLATMEQSCDSLLDGRTPTAVSPQCDKASRRPASFNASAAPVRSLAGKSIDLFAKPELNSDGFLTAVFSASGMKLRKNSSDTTVKSNDILGSAQDCLDAVPMSRGASIASGDIMVGKNSSLVIDRAGPDPFGLNAIKSKADCTGSNVIPEKFDFTVIYSAPGGRAVRRSDIKEIQDADLLSQVWRFGMMACQAKFNRSPAAALDRQRNKTAAGIYRHQGFKNKKCLNAKPQSLIGEACIMQCYNN